mmetsp:Transcript_21743/g.35893  ORF Transcript_21743/g.35893 Transcript_21743/m.35893 type:complete len:221 (-) Transcript_21743:712-1374(-)
MISSMSSSLSLAGGSTSLTALYIFFISATVSLFSIFFRVATALRPCIESRGAFAGRDPETIFVTVNALSFSGTVISNRTSPAFNWFSDSLYMNVDIASSSFSVPSSAFMVMVFVTSGLSKMLSVKASPFSYDSFALFGDDLPCTASCCLKSVLTSTPSRGNAASLSEPLRTMSASTTADSFSEPSRFSRRFSTPKSSLNLLAPSGRPRKQIDSKRCVLRW